MSNYLNEDRKLSEESGSRSHDAVKTKTSIIVSTHNSFSTLKATIESIIQNTFVPYELIVVSASSTDATNSQIPLLFPDVKLIEAPDVGWGEANNIGFEHSDGELLVFMGADCQVTPGWLDAILTQYGKLNNVGVLGSLVLKDGTYSVGGKFRFVPGLLWRDIKEFELKQVPFEFQYLRHPVCSRTVFHQIGGFDSSFFYTCDEIDFCLRSLRAGFKNYVIPGSIIYTTETPTSYKTSYYTTINQFRLITRFNHIFLYPIVIPFYYFQYIFLYFLLLAKNQKKARSGISDALKYVTINIFSIIRGRNKPCFRSIV